MDQAHKVDPKAPLKITPETVKDTMVFKLEKVLQMSAIDVDLDYAVKGMKLHRITKCFKFPIG